MEGLEKIVAIKASMNKGLSPELKAAFPNITPMDRPLVKNQTIKKLISWIHFKCAERLFNG